MKWSEIGVAPVLLLGIAPASRLSMTRVSVLVKYTVPAPARLLGICAGGPWSTLEPPAAEKVIEEGTCANC